jgi:hypothetical protein
MVCFSATGGIEVFFSHVLSIDDIYIKQIVLAGTAFAVLALIGLIELGRFSYRKNHLLKLISYAAIASALACFELLFHGNFHIVFLSQLVLIGISAYVMSLYYKHSDVDVLYIYFVINSCVALSVLFDLAFTHGLNLVDMANPMGIKKLSHLGFVNSFSYACAYAIVIGAMNYFKYSSIAVPAEKHAKKITILFLIIFPAVYLLISKCKGALAIAFAGTLFVLLPRKYLLTVLMVCMAMVVLFPKSSYELLTDVMMFGRTAAEGGSAEKIRSMFLCRYEASLFLDNPIQFLVENPWGVGSVKAWQVKHFIVEKNIIIKNHSLFFILIDAYGFFAILGFIITGFYLLDRLNGYTLLGMLFLSPILFINVPNIALSIPLMFLAILPHSQSVFHLRSLEGDRTLNSEQNVPLKMPDSILPNNLLN